MKRNKLFIAGLVTVFVALCSLTLVSSTWAKYTSTASGSDTARVAYWGFDEQEVVTLELFNNAYDNTVLGAAKVIAPGTSKTTTLQLTYSGATNHTAPEVDYVLTFKVGNESNIGNAIKTNPNIQWRAYSGAETLWTDWEGLATQLGAITIQGEAGAAVPTDMLTIEWQWVFSTDQDSVDTQMGNASTLESVTLEIEITATQVD